MGGEFEWFELFFICVCLVYIGWVWFTLYCVNVYLTVYRHLGTNLFIIHCFVNNIDTDFLEYGLHFLDSALQGLICLIVDQIKLYFIFSSLSHQAKAVSNVECCLRTFHKLTKWLL